MGSYRFFQNTDCEFFPCHDNSEGSLNCLFCFCPLYPKDCGGNYTFTDKGIKDCTNCVLPHSKCGYDIIIKKLKENSDGPKTNCP